MNLDTFSSTLQSGQLRVASHLADPHDDSAAVRLQVLERIAREAAPEGLPEFDPHVGVWALRRLHDACALYVHRDLGPEDVARSFSEPPPAAQSTPTFHWSADVALRHLPEVLRLCTRRSPQDPLTLALRDLAATVPLSSVGVDFAPPPPEPAIPAADGDMVRENPAPTIRLDHGPLLASDALRTLLLERIVTRKDSARAALPELRAALKAAAGAHPQLLGDCRATVF